MTELPETGGVQAGRSRVAFLVLPLAALAFQLATARGYGHFRDELYYLACADHLALGYVDHPPLIAYLTAAFRAVLGDSVVAIRVLPALCGAATVWLTAEIARAMGGRGFAQTLAALATATAPIFLALTGFLSMNCVDVLVWALLWLLLARLLGERDGRWWIPFGVACGVGLENKISVLFLGFGVVVGILATDRRRLLLDGRAWVAAGLCVLLCLPHVIWQVAEGWPTREFMANARSGKIAELSVGAFLKEQVLFTDPPSLPIWAGGLAALLVAGRLRAFRAVGIAYLVILAVFLVQGAKPYYLAAAYTALFAAGGVAWEAWTETRARWGAVVRALLLIPLPVSGALVAPMVKPVLPIETFVRYQAWLGLMPESGETHEQGRLPQFYADMLGWEELARAVADIRDGLPPEERERARVFGANYGQAGAIDLFGPALGLPPAISGHNAYHTWGPGDFDGEILIVIGARRETVEHWFEEVELGVRFQHPDAMPYEADKEIWIARRLRVPLAEFWAGVKSFG